MEFGRLSVILSNFILFLVFSVASAEEKLISVQSNVDKHTITLGDRIKYNLTVRYNPKIKLLPLNLGSRLGEFEVKDFKTYPEQNYSIKRKNKFSIHHSTP